MNKGIFKHVLSVSLTSCNLTKDFALIVFLIQEGKSAPPQKKGGLNLKGFCSQR